MSVGKRWLQNGCRTKVKGDPRLVPTSVVAVVDVMMKREMRVVMMLVVMGVVVMVVWVMVVVVMTKTAIR